MRKKILCLAVTLALPLIVIGCNTEGPAAVNDTILISQYRGLEVNEIEPIVIMEDDVEARIAQNIEASITTQEVKRKSRQGDVVNIDYKGKIDVSYTIFASTCSSTGTLPVGSYPVSTRPSQLMTGACFLSL